MASDFIADELLHVELTSRIAMELGGGAPYQVDFGRLAMSSAPALSSFARANELVVRLCCVGEAFSVPMLAGCMRSASHPLTHAVLETIVRDEAPHARLGWLYLEWASELMDDGERARLAGVALEQLRAFSPYWKRLRSRVDAGVTSEAARREVVQPFSRFGIVLPAADVEQLLATHDQA